VKTCGACGLPAPSTTLACALCSNPFPNQGPASYRLEPRPGGYRWTLDGEEVVSARLRDGSWDVFDAESGRLAVTLVAVAGDRTKVAMTDHRHRTVATFVPTRADGSSGFGLVRDGQDDLLMAVRGDGPTGMHVIDANGEVLALASRHRPASEVGMDLLLTRAGGSRSQTILFGLSLALELLRVGELVT
jgi:hypothetical protein